MGFQPHLTTRDKQRLPMLHDLNVNKPHLTKADLTEPLWRSFFPIVGILSTFTGRTKPFRENKTQLHYTEHVHVKPPHVNLSSVKKLSM